MSLGVKIPFYTTQEKVAKLKEFVIKVTKEVLKSENEEDLTEDSLFKKEKINETLDKVIKRIETERSISSERFKELEATKVKLTNATGDNSRLRREIDDLNAAHKSKIEAMKWSFSEAALQTWPYPKENSDRPPATNPDHIPQPSVDPAIPAGTCVICLDQKSSVACLPCGHMCMCQSCSGNVVKCPMCQQPIQELKKIFISKKMPAPANPFFI